MTQRIEGMELDESEDLLEELFAHLYAPENTLDHQWRERDIVFWDNLAVQHGRPNIKIDGPARTLRKIGLPIDPDLVPESLVASYESVS
jgi:taurine dioxygenase